VLLIDAAALQALEMGDSLCEFGFEARRTDGIPQARSS
jgi:hypothetical protein